MKIENYFNHISNSKLWDLACEFIIELGDKGFWQDVIKRFQGMIAYYKDTHYEHVAKDLCNIGTFTKEEYDIVKSLDKPIKSAEEPQNKGKNKNDRIK